jgi:hypothetical protein
MIVRQYWTRLRNDWRWLVALGLVALSLLYALIPLVDAVRPWNDFAFVAAAGRTWLKGLSPYDFERWNAEWVAIRPRDTHVAQRMPFMYPPHWGPIAVLFGALPWPVASRLWDVTSVLAFGGIVALSISLLGLGFREAVQRPIVWVMVAFAAFDPALHYTLWQSQLTVPPTLGIVGAFWAHSRRRPGWLVLFALLATLKPQLGFLPLFYLLLNGAHLELLIAGAIAVLVGVVSMLPSGLGRVASDVAHCYQLHMQVEFNSPTQFFNLPSLVAQNAPHAFMASGPIVASILVLGASYLRRARPAWAHGRLHEPFAPLALVAAIAAAFMPLHGYDLVILAPLLVFAHDLRRSWLGWLTVGLAIMAGRPALIERLLGFQHPQAYVTGALFVALVVALVRVEPIPAEREGVA